MEQRLTCDWLLESWVSIFFNVNVSDSVQLKPPSRPSDPAWLVEPKSELHFSSLEVPQLESGFKFGLKCFPAHDLVNGAISAWSCGLYLQMLTEHMKPRWERVAGSGLRHILLGRPQYHCVIKVNLKPSARARFNQQPRQERQYWTILRISKLRFSDVFQMCNILKWELWFAWGRFGKDRGHR